METSRPILEVRDLRTHFFTPEGVTRAVNGVTFSVARGQALGIVGESGSGKSTLALSLTGLLPPSGQTVGGEVLFDGEEILHKSARAMRELRGNRIGMIFQNPMASLNPVLTVGEHVREPFVFHGKATGRRALALAIAMLKAVGISSAGKRAADFPHTFSGGMRQRVMIASALSCHPDLLIADEPTTALDVSIQAQILTLLRDARAEYGAALIVITHNLGIVAETCDQAAVMYAGKIVEQGPVTELFDNPRHPYTRRLLDSMPRLGDRQKRLIPVQGSPPSLVNLPRGCAFADRCPHVMPICREQDPPMFLPTPDHQVRCFLEQEPA